METGTFRCGTIKATTELAKELNLPFDPSMQDWSYEVANPNDLDKYIAHYDITIDDDKKFVLLEIILQATVDQTDKERLLHYWQEIKPIINKDFKIHEYTIAYWASLNETNFEDSLILSPLLRELEKNNQQRDM